MRLSERIAATTLVWLAFMIAPTVWAGDLTVEGNLIVTSNVTAESYSGSGIGLSGVDADELDGVGSSGYVRIGATGNVGSVTLVGSLAVGTGCTAGGQHSFAQGSGSIASGNYSFAAGQGATASGHGSRAEGNRTLASGYYAHAEGQDTTASGRSSHAEGECTEASGSNSHAEGLYTYAIGSLSHAEGMNTLALGAVSFAAGEFADALHDNAYVWSDNFFDWGMTRFQSTTNCQYSVRARNGVRFVTGSGASVTVNDREVATLAYIPEQGDLSMGSFTNGLPQL